MKLFLYYIEYKRSNYMKKYFAVLTCASFLLFGALQSTAADRVKLSPDTPMHKIIRMNPAKVDPSDLPLSRIDELHTTGVTPDINIQNWRLNVDGKAVTKPLSLKYDDLLQMKTVSKKALLICPGFFSDYAEWEGVPLKEILKEARVSSDYKTVKFHAVDGYSKIFNRKEIDSNLFFLAFKVNGVVLPKDQGYPARLVAVDLYGGNWVKWIDSISVD
jgi:DMSO/TMAO reductase YedYZ molybdopterin-dependent catalytic subunit